MLNATSPDGSGFGATVRALRQNAISGVIRTGEQVADHGVGE
jgi:hypothetical protein